MLVVTLLCGSEHSTLQYFYSSCTVLPAEQQRDPNRATTHLPVLSAGISVVYTFSLTMSVPLNPHPQLHPLSLYNVLHLSCRALRNPACPWGADPRGASSLPGSPQQQGTGGNATLRAVYCIYDGVNDGGRDI